MAAYLVRKLGIGEDSRDVVRVRMGNDTRATVRRAGDDLYDDCKESNEGKGGGRLTQGNAERQKEACVVVKQ
jgi:hypothetical protein